MTVDVSTIHAESASVETRRDHVEVLGVPVDRVTEIELIQQIVRWVRSGQRRTVAYVNAHCLNVAFTSEWYQAYLRRADLVYADGQGVVWASQWLGRSLPERINMSSTYGALAEAAGEEGLRVFLFGSRIGVAERAGRRLQEQWPRLQVVGSHHGYDPATYMEGVTQAIHDARPDIVLVGLGVPAQERWMHEYAAAIGVPVIWGVGAALEYLAGDRARAPYWMRGCGLEWLHRLWQEPRRLWRRYLLGNPVFVYRVLRSKMRALPVSRSDILTSNTNDI